MAVGSHDDRWRLSWLRCRSLSPTIMVRGRQVVPGYEYQMREGIYFVEGSDVVAQLTSPLGERVVLTADSFSHIQKTHMGEDATSRFADPIKLGWLLRQVADRLPDEIRYESREAHLDFEHGSTVGTDIVAARQELVEDGRISTTHAASIDLFRREVVELNLFGTIDDQHNFIRRANRELEGTPANFVFRRDTIVPHFTTAPAQTTWWTVVIFATARYEPAGIRTMYPGRAREPFCGGRWFFRHYGADRASRGLAILDLLTNDRPLTKSHQRDAVEAQERAQRFWLQHALVGPVPPPASPPPNRDRS